jgi:RHS repeat-associated protein
VETKTITNPDDESPAQLIRFQFGNHLSSAILELDEQANVISYEEYYPYGSTSYQAVDKNVKATAKRYRYTGKERDEETGLYYHGARYYAPWLQRWTAADPIGIGDGVNPYAYVGGNPLTAIDSTGNDKDKIVDLSDPYGANLPPGGAPEQAPPPAEAAPPPAEAAPPPADAAPPPSDTAPPPAAPPPSDAAPPAPTPQTSSDEVPASPPTKPDSLKAGSPSTDGSSLLDVAKDVRTGLLHGLAQSIPVVGLFIPNQLSDTPRNTKSYELGRAAGQIGGGALQTFVIGPGLVGLGGGGAILGVATGPGELVIGPAGLAVAAGGVLVTANGVYNIGRGILTAAHAMAMSSGSGGSSGVKRITSPKHHPNSVSPEPKNVQELFDKSIVDEEGVRWAKDENGVIHRFSKPSNGESHWNGSTAGPDPIPEREIHIKIRRGL